MITARWFVYIMEGSDGTFYSGVTWRNSLCLGEQVGGLGRDYVLRHGMKQITYVQEYQNLKMAMLQEREISAKLRAEGKYGI